MTVEIRELAPSDADAVLALFEARFAEIPKGWLEPRRPEEIAALLSAEPGGCVGAFDGRRLVGYAMSRVAPWTPRAETPPLLRRLRAGEFAAEARGLAVDAAHEGRFIAGWMLEARRRLLAGRGVRHVLGAIVTGNLGSVAVMLRHGAALCGFEADSFGLANFTHCRGPLVGAPAGEEIEARSLAEIGRLFDEGFICRRIRLTGEGPVYLMRPT